MGTAVGTGTHCSGIVDGALVIVAVNVAFETLAVAVDWTTVEFRNSAAPCVTPTTKAKINILGDVLDHGGS
jgi:hypothetical protein